MAQGKPNLAENRSRDRHWRVSLLWFCRGQHPGIDEAQQPRDGAEQGLSGRGHKLSDAQPRRTQFLAAVSNPGGLSVEAPTGSPGDGGGRGEEVGPNAGLECALLL